MELLIDLLEVLGAVATLPTSAILAVLVLGMPAATIVAIRYLPRSSRALNGIKAIIEEMRDDFKTLATSLKEVVDNQSELAERIAYLEGARGRPYRSRHDPQNARGMHGIPTYDVDTCAEDLQPTDPKPEDKPDG